MCYCVRLFVQTASLMRQQAVGLAHGTRGSHAPTSAAFALAVATGWERLSQCEV
jgi:hypothetical protein